MTDTTRKGPPIGRLVLRPRPPVTPPVAEPAPPPVVEMPAPAPPSPPAPTATRGQPAGRIPIGRRPAPVVPPSMSQPEAAAAEDAEDLLLGEPDPDPEPDPEPVQAAYTSVRSGPPSAKRAPHVPPRSAVTGPPWPEDRPKPPPRVHPPSAPKETQFERFAREAEEARQAREVRQAAEIAAGRLWIGERPHRRPDLMGPHWPIEGDELFIGPPIIGDFCVPF